MGVSRTTETTMSTLRKELLSVAVNPTLGRYKVRDEARDLALEQRRVAFDDIGVVCFCHVRLGQHCAAKKNSSSSQDIHMLVSYETRFNETKKSPPTPL